MQEDREISYCQPAGEDPPSYHDGGYIRLPDYSQLHMVDLYAILASRFLRRELACLEHENIYWYAHSSDSLPGYEESAPIPLAAFISHILDALPPAGAKQMQLWQALYIISHQKRPWLWVWAPCSSKVSDPPVLSCRFGHRVFIAAYLRAHELHCARGGACTRGKHQEYTAAVARACRYMYTADELTRMKDELARYTERPALAGASGKCKCKWSEALQRMRATVCLVIPAVANDSSTDSAWPAALLRFAGQACASYLGKVSDNERSAILDSPLPRLSEVNLVTSDHNGGDGRRPVTTGLLLAYWRLAA